MFTGFLPFFFQMSHKVHGATMREKENLSDNQDGISNPQQVGCDRGSMSELV